MKLKNQVAVLESHDIPYYSIHLDLKWNEEEKRYKKKPKDIPKYKDIKLKNKFDKSKNASMIPLGKRYNGLIGVDVDNKNDTVEFFTDLSFENNFDMNTFTMKTIHNGKHFYFWLNEEQQEDLKDFMSSTALCFSTEDKPRNIDIKYTNQILFGPSKIYLGDETFKYEIENEHKPIELPDFLFQEILRTHKDQNSSSKNNIKEKKEKTIKKKDDNNQNENKIDKKQSQITRNYLDCLKDYRFKNFNEWLRLGAITYNVCNDYNLFDEYSKNKCPEKYTDGCCKKVWDSFKNDREKKVTIKKLIEMAEEDTKDNPQLFLKAILNDKQYILNQLFYYGPTDLHMSYLFACLYKDEFIYDTINKSWYYFNQYGIYMNDKEGLQLKKNIDSCFIREIKLEYNRRVEKIDVTEDKNAKVAETLFKKYKELIKYCCKAKNAEELMIKLKTIYTIEKIYIKMDNANPNLLGFDNGVLDIESGEFRVGKKEDYISTTTGYKYNKPNKKLREEAMNILRSIFPNKEELSCMLKKISLGLYGGNPYEKFSVWIGTGGNGKGVLRDIIKIVLGDYYDSMEISYLYKSNVIKSDAPNPVMAKKKNSRYVISTEPEGDIVLKSSTIKQQTGNDDQQVRKLYGDSFNFVPKFKLVIQTNTEPVFYGFDGGMARRTELFSFPISFVDNPTNPNERKIDYTLKNKILIDKIYTLEFLDIFLEHYQLYKKEGLVMPERFRKETDEFIKSNLPVKCWIEDNYDITRNKEDKYKSSDLYKRFEDYMDSNVCGVTTLLFKNQLSALGVVCKKCKDGNYYLGIKRKGNDDDKKEDDSFSI